MTRESAANAKIHYRPRTMYKGKNISQKKEHIINLTKMAYARISHKEHNIHGN